MEQNTSNLFDLHIDPQSQSYLGETARWAKFLAIVGFIMCALIIIVAIFAGSYMSSAFDAFGGGYGSGMGATVIVFYVLVALLVFFPYLYLYRFATKMQVALRNNDQQNLTSSFASLKSCYKFIGILTIIGLALYALIIIFAILGAGMAGI